MKIKFLGLILDLTPAVLFLATIYWSLIICFAMFAVFTANIKLTILMVFIVAISMVIQTAFESKI